MSPSRWLLRAREAAGLLRHAGGPVSFARLLAVYATTARDPRSLRPVELILTMAGRRVPLAMRASDVYTLAEVLHEGQYDIARRLPGAPFVVDAGANIGVASLWFLAARPRCRLLAVEPEAANFALLEHNLRAAPGAVAVRAALGREEGTVELFVAGHGALHTTRPEVAAGAGASRETVPARRLDRLLEESGEERVDLVKLDVEGAELDALEGLGSWVERVERIAGEVHERVVPAAALEAWLTGRGFRVELHDFPSAAGKGVRGFEAARR